MTTANDTTPRTTRTIVTAQHVTKVSTTGEAVCTCPSFKAAKAMYGEGYCRHLRQATHAAQEVH